MLRLQVYLNRIEVLWRREYTCSKFVKEVFIAEIMVLIEKLVFKKVFIDSF